MKMRMTAALVGVLALVAAGGASAKPTQPLRVGMVQRIGGHPGTDNIGGAFYLGFVRAAHLPGVQGRIVQIGPSGDPLPALEFLARQQYDVIVTPWWDLSWGEATLARKHPHTIFLVSDVPWRSKRDPPNLVATLFRPQESAFLAGYLAALVEARASGAHVISAVGGLPIQVVNVFIAGFRAGARYADPTVKVLINYSYDFTDPVKCARVADEQIARGSGVVFNVAGACGAGALREARRKGVWGVGVDVDQSNLGPFVLTSVLKRVDLSVERALVAIRDHSYPRNRMLVFDEANGGVGIGKISPRVPRAFVSRMKQVEAAIKAGRLHVPSTL
jgi:basic membrane protein A and related proteins